MATAAIVGDEVGLFTFALFLKGLFTKDFRMGWWCCVRRCFFVDVFFVELL